MGRPIILTGFSWPNLAKFLNLFCKLYALSQIFKGWVSWSDYFKGKCNFEELLLVKMVLWNIKPNNIRTVQFRKHVEEEGHSWPISDKCYLWFIETFCGSKKRTLTWNSSIKVFFTISLHISYFTTALKRPHLICPNNTTNKMKPIGFFFNSACQTLLSYDNDELFLWYS